MVTTIPEYLHGRYLGDSRSFSASVPGFLEISELVANCLHSTPYAVITYIGMYRYLIFFSKAKYVDHFLWLSNILLLYHIKIYNIIVALHSKNKFLFSLFVDDRWKTKTDQLTKIRGPQIYVSRYVTNRCVLCID